MHEQDYILSFTAAGVLRAECVLLAELHARLGDWDAVRSTAVADNLLQARKAASATRVCRELVFRLQGLSDEELALLRQGNPNEQDQILWVAICRRYRLVAEFALEVLRERFLQFGPPLELSDFDAFYDRKADWAEELDQLASVTRAKLRQVLFRMLREAGLTSADGSIQPTLLSDRVRRVVGRERPADLLYFPVFEADLARRA
jgi:hypothetical protein